MLLYSDNNICIEISREEATFLECIEIQEKSFLFDIRSSSRLDRIFITNVEIYDRYFSKLNMLFYF